MGREMKAIFQVMVQQTLKYLGKNPETEFLEEPMCKAEQQSNELQVVCAG